MLRWKSESNPTSNVSDSHLTDESLLLLDTGELSPEDEVKATDHIALCQSCRRRREETAVLLSDLGTAVSMADRRRFEWWLTVVHWRRLLRWPEIVRPAYAATSALAVGLIALLVWNSSVPMISAKELLGRAVREELARPQRATYIRISDGRSTCMSSEPACEHVRFRLRSLNWDVDHALSAKNFERWRSSLTKKTDTVSVNESAFSVRTSTQEGVLRAATLRVRSSDYRAFATKLEVDGFEPIEITEEAPPEAIMATAPIAVPPSRRDTPSEPRPAVEASALLPADPLDTAEIQTRVALHKLAADSGFESIVQRGAGRIGVFALVKDDARRSELTSALGAIAGLDIRIRTYAEFEPGDDERFPKGETGNTLPPVAAQWLKVTYPNLQERAAFVNRVERISTEVLGEAAILSELRQSPVAEALLEIRQDHEQRILSLLIAIGKELEPLTGPMAQRREASPLQAQTLDSSVTRLFSTSRSGAGSLDEEITRIRAVLETIP